MKYALSTKLLAEFLGTFLLVFGGCGSAVLAAAFPHLGIGFAGVALAFGLTVLTGAYAFGPVSGGHFNPAVSLGLAVAGRLSWGELLPYIATQVVASVVASTALYVIASGGPDFSLAGGFASNGYGLHSPGGYSGAEFNDTSQQRGIVHLLGEQFRKLGEVIEEMGGKAGFSDED